MAFIQPRTPAGTLELLPQDQQVHQYMLDVIRKNYEKFGFIGIETPVFEIKDMLLTKSGGETEQQVYLVQSTGAQKQGQEADLALRFDLTVPLARYVAQHERELAFPFRRYQIQRVYRGERPQKGRAREFYQCDIDVIGKDKLDAGYDAEMPAIIVEIFTALGLEDFTIHFNNRKVLQGLLNAMGVRDDETKKLILREIDKRDKIGDDNVAQALQKLGLTRENIEKLLALLSYQGSKDEVLEKLRAMEIKEPLFEEGVAALALMVQSLRALGVAEKFTRINLGIARGLDYYTGTVYETLLDKAPKIGSICSGGRYENLASLYTRSKLPGVGISIGLTRLYEILEELNLLPTAPATVQIFIPLLAPDLRADTLVLAKTLRAQGFTVETYLEDAKLEKQMKYAAKKEIPFVLLLGAEEKQKNIVQLRDMNSKTQTEIPRDQLMASLKNLL
ncbi:MAG: histidine--tRNA ligase [Alphaproteobacteria bacterium]|nr:histidine--tRNA ligase [Alphaproteobacteria bacterium]